MKTLKPTQKNVFRYICEHLDEDLDSPACREIKDHLAACRHCTNYLDSLKAMITLYRRYPVPPLSSKAKQRLRRLAR